MTLLHALGIALLTAVWLFVTVVPFLPGRHDPLAFPVSAMARVAAGTSLLFVPIGIVWWIRGGAEARPQARARLALASLVIAGIVLAAVSGAALVFSGPALAIGVLAVSGTAMAKGRAMVRAVRSGWIPRARVLGAYAIVVPVAVAALQAVVVPRAVDFARARAIRNSVPLIAEVEQYRRARGRCPASLLAVNQDYPPGIIGIRRYEYEPNGDSFNLLFEQPTTELSAREIVVFNPRGEPEATSHDSDLLRRTPGELVHWRGYFSVQDVAPNWKLFRFD